MNDTEIRTFLEVANTLNFTEAAKRIYLSQQAVSKYVLNLEDELGVTLFDRRAGQVQLTEAGEYYHTMFSDWVYAYHQTHNEITLHYQMMTSRFGVGFSSWIDPYGELMDCLESFRGQFPTTNFHTRQYVHAPLLQALREGELDVALIAGSDLYLEKEYETFAVADAATYLFVPSEIRADAPDPACFGLPLLVPDTLDWGKQAARYLLSRLSAEDGLRPERADICPNAQDLIALLSSGRCVSISDDRFSVLHRVKNARRFPLPRRRKLFCVWYTGNENPLIPEFVRSVCRWFGSDCPAAPQLPSLQEDPEE